MIEEEVVKLILDNGILGIIIAWFMLRMEKLIKANTEALILVKEHLESLK